METETTKKSRRPKWATESHWEGRRKPASAGNFDLDSFVDNQIDFYKDIDRRGPRFRALQQRQAIADSFEFLHISYLYLLTQAGDANIRACLLCHLSPLTLRFEKQDVPAAREAFKTSRVRDFLCPSASSDVLFIIGSGGDFQSAETAFSQMKNDPGSYESLKIESESLLHDLSKLPKFPFQKVDWERLQSALDFLDENFFHGLKGGKQNG